MSKKTYRYYKKPRTRPEIKDMNTCFEKLERESGEIIENKHKMLEKLQSLEKRTLRKLFRDMMYWFDCVKQNKKWVKYIWITFLVYRAIATIDWTYEKVILYLTSTRFFELILSILM